MTHELLDHEQFSPLEMLVGEEVFDDMAERDRADEAFRDITSRINLNVSAETKEALQGNGDGKTCGDRQNGVRYA